MDIRNNYITDISIYTTGFVLLVKFLNRAGLFDINKHSENFLIPVLNKVFDLKLKNLNNTQKANFPSIDLGDFEKKTAFQITSTNTIEKVKDTLEKFIKYDQKKYFDNLYIFVISEEKANYKEQKLQSIIQGNFEFLTAKHIIYIGDLIQKISSIESIRKIAAIHKIFKQEFPQFEKTCNVIKRKLNGTRRNSTFHQTPILYKPHISCNLSSPLKDYLENEFNIESIYLDHSVLLNELNKAFRISKNIECQIILLGIFLLFTRSEISCGMQRVHHNFKIIQNFENEIIPYLESTKLFNEAIVYTMMQLFVYYHEFDFLPDSKIKTDMYAEKIKRIGFSVESKLVFDRQLVQSYLWRSIYKKSDVGEIIDNIGDCNKFAITYERELNSNSIASMYLNFGWLYYKNNILGCEDYFNRSVRQSQFGTRTHDDAIVANYFINGINHNRVQDIDLEDYINLLDKILWVDGRQYRFMGGSEKHFALINALKN